ncbi:MULTISPECIES: hypothetical protein [Spirulina sp. CCY15215]|nr:hypothetical protein [Spirulina major]
MVDHILRPYPSLFVRAGRSQPKITGLTMRQNAEICYDRYPYFPRSRSR